MSTAGESAFGPLPPTRRLTDVVVERIGREIVDGRLKAGDRLPTEQEMMDAFRVSRTVVREAVAALKADGLVESRQGRGVFVASDPGRRPFRIDPQELKAIDRMVALMELRLAVEVEAASLAAGQRTAADLARMDKALVRIDREAARGGSAVDEDFAFHFAIAQATRNPYFERFLAFLGGFIIPRRTIRVGLVEADARRAYLARVQTEHRTILDAIRAGDADAARTAMRRHLDNSRARYSALGSGAGPEDGGRRARAAAD